jgi:hypothetical protein
MVALETRHRRRTRRRWDAGAVLAVVVASFSMGAQPAQAAASPDGDYDGDYEGDYEGDYVTTSSDLTRSLDVTAFSPECIRDVPYIRYTIVPVGFASTGPATLTFFDRSGNLVEQRVVATLSGSIVYPGVSTDGAGNATDWPGWKRADDGSWVPDPSDAFLREGLTIRVEVNPTATATVSYPAASTPCAGPAPGSPTTTVCAPGDADCSLPRTGGGPGRALIVGAGTLLAGMSLLAAARRRQFSFGSSPR